MMLVFLWSLALLASSASIGTATRKRAQLAAPQDYCPGYNASNVRTSSSSITADLTLAASPCNAYGTDIKNLRLEVSYETGQFSIQNGPT